jgi:hypothetical protein
LVLRYVRGPFGVAVLVSGQLEDVKGDGDMPVANAEETAKRDNHRSDLAIRGKQKAGDGPQNLVARIKKGSPEQVCPKKLAGLLCFNK